MASRTHVAHALTAGLAVLLLVAAPRLAGASPAWSGTWWSLGGAYSSTKADCRDCAEQEYKDTGTIIARGGYAVSPRVRIGGEYTRTYRQESGPDSRLSTFSAIAQWNMVRAVPVLIEVGYGISKSSYTIEDNGNLVGFKRNGIALHFGVGSEWPVGPLAIGPYGAMYVAGLGDVQTPTSVARDALVVTWIAGLTLTVP